MDANCKVLVGKRKDQDLLRMQSRSWISNLHNNKIIHLYFSIFTLNKYCIFAFFVAKSTRVVELGSGEGGQSWHCKYQQSKHFESACFPKSSFTPGMTTSITYWKIGSQAGLR